MNDVVVHSLGDVFSSGQIRLAELSVYNWGSFQGLHSARIDREGTLITGDNGAGKSTLVDGLMALLLPAGKAAFNVAAAQGDRTDRSLVSYIRGSFGTAHDGSQTQTLNKRQGAVVTALRAYYRADDTSEITLAALFWMTQASNALADLKRIYIVAKRNLPLEQVLEAFGQGQARGLKQRLREDPLVAVFDDHFSEYQEAWRRLLHIENRNAPALLARALGLKKIDDLTALIRELVLEPSKVREDARKAVSEFDDLVTTHDRLIDARRQRDALAGLPELAEALQGAERELVQLGAEQDGLASYFGAQCYRLWSRRVDTLEREVTDTEQTLAELDTRIERAQARVDNRHADYVQAGGGRIETLESELDNAKHKLNERTLAAADYQRVAREAKLDPALTQAAFQANQHALARARATTDDERTAAQNALIEAGARYSDLQKQQRDLDAEIAEIEARPDSNIDTRFQRLRDEMVSALGFDRRELMFIGELVDVQPEHRAWQGAIERALGGLRTTLTVPSANFSLVTRWLNERHTGLHVRVQVVGEVQGRANFKVDGYLKKLIWREHPYREWLKQHLARFDLHCVETTAVLDQTPFSLTQQGLMHRERGRFEKKDQHRVDDRRNWQLGFSNKARLAILRRDASELKLAVETGGRSVVAARAEVDAVEQNAKRLETLATFRWDMIDVPRWQLEVQTLKTDLERLQRAGGDLLIAKRLWEEAKRALHELQMDRSRASERMGALRADTSSAVEAQRKALAAANAPIDDGVRESLATRVGDLHDADLALAVELEATHRKAIDEQWRTVNERKQSTSQRAVGAMASFRRGWPVAAADWGIDLLSLRDYLDYLKALEEEGLPALVEQFKERLNRHTTQSLARIRSTIDSEREDIHERIETINTVLARTEFHSGTHLRLRTRQEQYPHVQDFNQQLMAVLGQVGSDDHEARFAALKLVIDVLEKATTPTSANTLESLRLLDPRYQLSFFAEELNTGTNDVRDVLESSSGKSGGEKEAFAGTIVAASLAYVLTPDGGTMPVYTTVFLDEAFSNTAEAVSRRVLRVFRELKIHVNLITPYKNLDLARESARSALIIERDSDTHESALCEVTWEELDRLQERRANRLARQATALGVQLEPSE